MKDERNARQQLPHPSPFRKRKVWESNPQEPSRLRQFSGLRGLPVPNLPCLMHQEGLEPPTPRRATALQAAAEPIRPLMRAFFADNSSKLRVKNLLEAGNSGARREPLPRDAHVGAPPPTPQGTSVVKQQKKRAGPLASHRKQARSAQVSTKAEEISGAGGPPPLL